MDRPIVLVTGALTGIGRATALAFAQNKARVAISGRNESRGRELWAELSAAGADALFVRADVRREEDVRNLVAQATGHFGRLDVAVNNAAVEGRLGPLLDQDLESYAEVFDCNVLGTLLCMKYEAAQMLKQGGGAIVNVSSVYGHRGAPSAGLYGASKHAVEGLTRTAALELADAGIRVNAVAPGPTDTQMLDRISGTPQQKAELGSKVPLKRIAAAEEIAQAIVFLASTRASFVTGHTLHVDGGKSA